MSEIFKKKEKKKKVLIQGFMYFMYRIDIQ